MKFTSSFIAVFVVLSLGVTWISCDTKNQAVPEDLVYYYPEKNVYYDSLRAKYFYSLDGAKTWDSLPFRAPLFGVGLGPAIPVQRSRDSIWIDNASHRTKYNGVLLNIVNSRTLALLKADRINKLKVVVKAKTQPQPVAVEEKEPAVEKGLKKFFRKLFGKKKKPEDQPKEEKEN